MIAIKINNRLVGLYEDEMLQTTEKLFTALKLHITERWNTILIQKGTGGENEIKTK
jgi:hypothetical protein